MKSGLRAAVIGAGRIGRHHAKWLAKAGCEVAGFVVSDPAHIAARDAEVRPDCPNLGPGFADVGAMLAAVRPQLVCVCSPAERHAEHARLALESGAAVLCEKPICWHDDPAQARQQAADLVRLAALRKVRLGVNLQYTYAAAAYRKWVKPGDPETCEVTLESRGRGAERQPGEVWMELGPHALSLAFGLLPGYQIDPRSVRVATAPRTVEARFELQGDFLVEATVRVAQRLEGDLTRSFGLNGQRVTVAGRNNDAGEFATYLVRGTAEREYPDLMRTSIERFVAAVRGEAVEVVDGEVGRRNLEAQLLVGAKL